MLFSYGLVLTLVATLAGFFLPNTERPGRVIPERLM